EKKLKDKDDAQVIDKDFKFTRIWVIDVTSHKSVELVKGDYNGTDPQWSPDSRRLAFVINPTPKADDSTLSDIWVIDVASAASDETQALQKKLSELKQNLVPLEAKGGPTYFRYMEVQSQIASVQGEIAQKSTLRRLTNNEGPDTSPRWSPNGKSIAYLSRELKGAEVGQLGLTLLNVESGAIQPLARNFEYQPGGPKWSPDGRQLYFTAPARTESRMFSVPSVGGEAKELGLTGVMSQASFSRDGTVISFTKSDTQHPDDVYVARFP